DLSDAGVEEVLYELHDPGAFARELRVPELHAVPQPQFVEPEGGRVHLVQVRHVYPVLDTGEAPLRQLGGRTLPEQVRAGSRHIGRDLIADHRSDHRAVKDELRGAAVRYDGDLVGTRGQRLIVDRPRSHRRVDAEVDQDRAFVDRVGLTPLPPELDTYRAGYQGQAS